MTRKAYISDSLGDRIRRLRLERGWTQTQLAEKAGCTKRAIIYYEKDGKYPPAPTLAAMAGAFGMNLESLMAPEEPEVHRDRDEPNLLESAEDRRLWRKFRILKNLPERDQQAILRLINVTAEVQESRSNAG